MRFVRREMASEDSNLRLIVTGYVSAYAIRWAICLFFIIARS